MMDKAAMLALGEELAHAVYGEELALAAYSNTIDRDLMLLLIKANQCVMYSAAIIEGTLIGLDEVGCTRAAKRVRQYMETITLGVPSCVLRAAKPL